MIKICKYVYLHLSIIHFYHFVMVTLQTHFWPFSLNKNYEKARMELFKKLGGEWSKKLKRLYIKYFLTIYFLTETTQKCANFVNTLLVLYFSIFSARIIDFDIPMAKLSKYEIWAKSLYYNGGEVVYLL